MTTFEQDPERSALQQEATLVRERLAESISRIQGRLRGLSDVRSAVRRRVRQLLVFGGALFALTVSGVFVWFQRRRLQRRAHPIRWGRARGWRRPESTEIRRLILPGLAVALPSALTQSFGRVLRRALPHQT